MLSKYARQEEDVDDTPLVTISSETESANSGSDADMESTDIRPESFLRCPNRGPVQTAKSSVASVFANCNTGSITGDQDDPTINQSLTNLEKLNLLKQELAELKKGKHGAFVKGCATLKQYHRTNMDTAEAGYEQMLKQIEEDYKTEVKLIKEECATAAAALKERLIKELEEEKKQIDHSAKLIVEDEVRVEVKAPPETQPCERYALRRSLRLNQMEPELSPAAAGSKRKKRLSALPRRLQLDMEVDEQAIVGDLEAMHSAIQHKFEKLRVQDERLRVDSDSS